MTEAKPNQTLSVVSSDTFKNALRSWASGVTIVTACAGDRYHGMTVSAFTSVSADPPLVLVCANRKSDTHDIIEKGKVFAVNILSADQGDLSQQFAMTKGPARFEGVEWYRGVTGAPLLAGALVHLECRVRSAHQEGSHTIYIGEVLSASSQEGEALVYCSGKYHTVGE